MTDYVLAAKARNDLGKGASRRLRRLAAEVPAIVYGGDKAPLSISLIAKDFAKSLEDEAFYSHIIKLDIDGTVEQVVLKALQRHPAKEFVLHADFQRVDATHVITMRVPVHLTNVDKCVGVKMGGGSLIHNMTELEVKCLPQQLPEFIEVDVAELAVGQVLHISDLKLPQGVESVQLAHGEDHNQPVVSVLAPRGGAAEESAGE
jgi:large subunit ribosomal protein L25